MCKQGLATVRAEYSTVVMHALFNSEEKGGKKRGAQLFNQITVHVPGRPVRLYNSSLCVDLLREKHWGQ